MGSIYSVWAFEAECYLLMLTFSSHYTAGAVCLSHRRERERERGMKGERKRREKRVGHRLTERKGDT